MIRCDKFCGLPPVIVIVESFSRFFVFIAVDDVDADDDVATMVNVDDDDAGVPETAAVVDGNADDDDDCACPVDWFVVDDTVKCCICSVV